MITEERRVEFTRLCEKAYSIMITKGKDYAQKDDVLANFKELEMVGMTKYQSVGVYLFKQMKAILNAIKRNPDFPEVSECSEDMESRICDSINYLVLLSCLMQEDRRGRAE